MERNVTRTASFSEDLGANDLDPMPLFMALETEFNIKFTEDEMANCRTLGEISDLVTTKVKTRARNEYSATPNAPKSP
ncbi:MAG: hypothetical protein QOK24_237 [Verrucomicrobiota bacterium]